MLYIISGPSHPYHNRHSHTQTEIYCAYTTCQVLAGEGNRFTRSEIRVGSIAGDLVKMSILEKLGYATFKEFEEDLREESEKIRQAYADCGRRLFETKIALRALIERGASDPNEEEAFQLAKEGILLEAELRGIDIRHALNQKKLECLALEVRHLKAIKEKVESNKEGSGEGTSRTQENLVVEIPSTDDLHNEAASEGSPSASPKAVADEEDNDASVGMMQI